MSARSKARKRALDILFEADSKGIPASNVLAEQIRRRQESGEPAFNPHTVALVEGVVEHQAEVDASITGAASGWTIERMPAVDRAVLRLGAYEILFDEAVPAQVAISEAVELASSLSTDASPAFVNGVLGAVAASNRSQAGSS